jgi:carboxylesterase
LIDLSADERVRGFELDGGRAGCLLLHGFTGTPSEMRPLGEHLAARGYTVCAPLLPGHGTRVDELARMTWKDWFSTAVESWDALGRRASERVVAGLSMGALLALHLAHERSSEVRAVAALAPALELASQRSAEIALWVRWFPRLPRRLAIVPKRGAKLPGFGRLTPAYDEIPLRALASMIGLQRLVRAELPLIRTPALVLQGGRDDTVSSGAGAAIETALGSPIKALMRFEQSGHILTEDSDAAQVLRALERFFTAHVSPVS